jgi:hypothetical protein
LSNLGDFVTMEDELANFCGWCKVEEVVPRNSTNVSSRC